MARSTGNGDFSVDVEDLGLFTFGRRTAKDVFRISGEYNRLTDGNFSEEGAYNDIPALAYATLKVLCVQSPDSFNFEKIDALMSDEWQYHLVKIFSALREKELSFRKNDGAGLQTPSA